MGKEYRLKKTPALERELKNALANAGLTFDELKVIAKDMDERAEISVIRGGVEINLDDPAEASYKAAIESELDDALFGGVVGITAASVDLKVGVFGAVLQENLIEIVNLAYLDANGNRDYEVQITNNGDGQDTIKVVATETITETNINTISIKYFSDPAFTIDITSAITGAGYNIILNELSSTKIYCRVNFNLNQVTNNDKVVINFTGTSQFDTTVSDTATIDVTFREEIVIVEDDFTSDVLDLNKWVPTVSDDGLTPISGSVDEEVTATYLECAAYSTVDSTNDGSIVVAKDSRDLVEHIRLDGLDAGRRYIFEITRFFKNKTWKSDSAGNLQIERPNVCGYFLHAYDSAGTHLFGIVAIQTSICKDIAGNVALDHWFMTLHLGYYTIVFDLGTNPFVTTPNVDIRFDIYKGTNGNLWLDGYFDGEKKFSADTNKVVGVDITNDDRIRFGGGAGCWWYGVRRAIDSPNSPLDSIQSLLPIGNEILSFDKTFLASRILRYDNVNLTYYIEESTTTVLYYDTTNLIDDGTKVMPPWETAPFYLYDGVELSSPETTTPRNIVWTDKLSVRWV